MMPYLRQEKASNENPFASEWRQLIMQKEIVNKTRLWINERFENQNIWIEFDDQETKSTYRYPHDKLINEFREKAPKEFFEGNWKNLRYHNWPTIPIEQGKFPFVRPFLSKYTVL